MRKTQNRSSRSTKNQYSLTRARARIRAWFLLDIVDLFLKNTIIMGKIQVNS